MKKQLDPKNDVQKNLFNEKYMEVCNMLCISTEITGITFAQAATALGVSEATVKRYAYSNPPSLELAGQQYANRGVTIDSVVMRLLNLV